MVIAELVPAPLLVVRTRFAGRSTEPGVIEKGDQVSATKDVRDVTARSPMVQGAAG